MIGTNHLALVTPAVVNLVAHFATKFQSGIISAPLVYNVLHIPEGGDFETQNYQLTMNKHRSTDFHFSTNAPLLGICCYRLPFFVNQTI